MPERYTIRELTAMLGVDGNTVQAWRKALGIEAEQDKYDHRRFWISAFDAQRIADEHARILSPLPDELPRSLPDAHRRISQLLGEIQRLRSEIASLKSSSVSIGELIPARPKATPLNPGVQATIPTIRSRTVQYSRSNDTFPHDYLTIRDAAKQLDVPLRTMKRWLGLEVNPKTGLPSPRVIDVTVHAEGWRRGTAVIKYAFTPDQVLALKSYIHRAGRSNAIQESDDRVFAEQESFEQNNRSEDI